MDSGATHQRDNYHRGNGCCGAHATAHRAWYSADGQRVAACRPSSSGPAILVGATIYSLRMAFGSLLQVAMGIGMVVVILEASHSRVEELNDKLRRLTLITAASTQTLSVDEVLKVVLENLVESLGATHGVARLLTGEGDAAELTLRAMVGLDEEYKERYERIPATEPWSRAVLQQNVPWVCHLQEDAPAGLRERMETENISTMVFVRLPGKDAPLGVLGIASASRRRFQAGRN